MKKEAAISQWLDLKERKTLAEGSDWRKETLRVWGVWKVCSGWKQVQEHKSPEQLLRCLWSLRFGNVGVLRDLANFSCFEFAWWQGDIRSSYTHPIHIHMNTYMHTYIQLYVHKYIYKLMNFTCTELLHFNIYTSMHTNTHKATQSIRWDLTIATCTGSLNIDH